MRRSVWQFLFVVACFLALAAAANRFMAENAQRAEAAQQQLGVVMVLSPVSTAALAETPLSTPAAVPSPMNVMMHTVQRGQSLYQIAAQYGVTIENIVAVNHLANPELIYAGQELMIPVSNVSPASDVTDAPPAAPTASAASETPFTSITIIPTATVTVAPSPTRSGTLTPVQFRLPLSLNDVPLESILVLPPEVTTHVRRIYALGQQLGRDAHAFSKLGDSIIQSPHFLIRFDTGPYNLGPYGYLQTVIDTYKGSFGRDGMAVRKGLHSWSIFDPMWAPKPTCQPGENLLECEIRVHNPSILLVQMGTNDVGIPDVFERNMRQVVDLALANGVVPVLFTKADRHEGGDINNPIIRQIAADEQVPLLDFDRIAATLPNHGLDQDGVHLKVFFAHDYTLPEAMQRGHAVQNLVTLMMLARLEEMETKPLSRASITVR